MNILFAYCRNHVPGILTLTAARHGRVVIHNYALRGGAAGPQGSGSYLTGPTAPDPFPALGTGPVTPRVPEKGKLRANSQGLGSPYGSGTSPHPSGPPTRVEPIYRRGGVRGRHVSRRRRRGASFPLEDSPTHRIQCGWLGHALPPRHAGQLLSGLTVDRILPRYTVQPHAPHPRRARLPH